MSTRAQRQTTIDREEYVRAIVEGNRWPAAQLKDLVVRYSCTDRIGRLDPSDELVRWTATLELPFDDEDCATTERVVIATASCFSFNIFESSWDPNDVLDSHSGDTAVYRSLFDTDGDLLDELVFMSARTRLVIADRGRRGQTMAWPSLGPIPSGTRTMSAGGRRRDRSVLPSAVRASARPP